MSNLEVQSEIYNEKSTFKNISTLPNGNTLARLEFLNDPFYEFQVDEDGDFLVNRNKNNLELEFSSSTTIPLVGLQIWRGALVLADFILFHHEIFNKKNVLELGSGVGLAGIVAGIHAKEVVCSDLDKGGILELIKRNISRNKNIISGLMSATSLDFYQQDWSADLSKKIKQTDIVIAADVIYDDSLTEAFIHCITKILLTPPKKKLYFALEKRYVFTVADLDSIAPCYEYFLKCLKNAWTKRPMCNWLIKEIKIDFVQYFAYVRTNELVLWEITV